MDGYGEMRTPHYLTSVKRCSIPSRLIFVDTESLPIQSASNPKTQVHSFRLGTAVYCRIRGQGVFGVDWLHFTHVTEFWEWVESKMDPKHSTWLYAHSLGFDLTMLDFWSTLDNGHFRVCDPEWQLRGLMPRNRQGGKPWRGLLVLEDPPNIISVKAGDATLQLVDTRNYWPGSLADLGKHVGIPKLAMPSFQAPTSAWLAYCRRDTEIIYNAVTRLLLWWKGNNLGPWRSTAAGLAWNCYRHKFLKEPVLIHGHKRALRLERDSYFGGECRCFYVGGVIASDDFLDLVKQQGKERAWRLEPGPIYHLDVKNMYPSVMKGNRFPVKLVQYHHKGTVNTLEQKGLDYVAEVELNQMDEEYPVRAIKTQEVHYARGRFVTVLAGPELRRALEKDQILSVGRVAVYETADLFTEFVDYFWPRLIECQAVGNRTHYLFLKLILNSLGGRFGMRQHKWEDFPEEPPFRPWGQWYHGEDEDKVPQLYRSIGLHSQRYMRSGEGVDSFPAISAFITSYARLAMKDFRKVAGPGNVFYQDTDSLHVNALGWLNLGTANMVRENELGFLRLVERVDEGHYYGRKHYKLGDRLVVGSVARNAVEGSENEYTYLQFQGLPSILARRPSATVSVTEVTKTVSLCHPDGTVMPSGWVEPITLS